jgi:hypothetical protein
VAYFTSSTKGNKKITGDYSITGIPNITCPTYLFKLTTSSGAVVATAQGAVAGPTRKKLKITIDGTTYWLLAANDWVTANSASRSPSSSISPSA